MIKLDNVTCGYGDVLPIKELSRELPDAGVVAVLGASGSGKSTLLKLLAGLLEPISGSVTGMEGKRISMVFQENRLPGHLSAKKNLELAAPDADAMAALESVELAGFANKRVSELSGGQQRRVALARALCYGGDILLLDEPFSGVGEEQKARIAARIRGAFPLTVIATHDAGDAKLLGDGPVISL